MASLIAALQTAEAQDANAISALQSSSSNQESQIAALQTAEAQDASAISALQAASNQGSQIAALQTAEAQDANNIAALQAAEVEAKLNELAAWLNWSESDVMRSCLLSVHQLVCQTTNDEIPVMIRMAREGRRHPIGLCSRLLRPFPRLVSVLPLNHPSHYLQPGRLVRAGGQKNLPRRRGPLPGRRVGDSTAPSLHHSVGTQSDLEGLSQASDGPVSLSGAFRMSDDKAKFLGCRHLPGRLNVIETSWYLGFSESDIPVLASRKLLTPVGNPTQSATKYYALKDLKKVHEDARWIHRATAVLNRYWQLKNENRKK